MRVFGLQLVVALMVVVVVEAGQGDEVCTLIRGDCRLVATLKNPDDPLTTFKALNVSCECKHGQVSMYI